MMEDWNVGVGQKIFGLRIADLKTRIQKSKNGNQSVFFLPTGF
jgi:hypothetical protein